MKYSPRIASSFNGDGVLICSIDNMPTQIPTEATEYFGNLLLPYVPDFVSTIWVIVILNLTPQAKINSSRLKAVS